MARKIEESIAASISGNRARKLPLVMSIVGLDVVLGSFYQVILFSCFQNYPSSKLSTFMIILRSITLKLRRLAFRIVFSFTLLVTLLY